MKLPISLPKPRRPKLLVVRRVVGRSMLPRMVENRVVLASRHFRSLQPGDVVIIWHGGLEKIKRVQAVQDEMLFVLGDNPSYSTDSRSFGWLPLATVQAKVIWPR